MGQPFVTIVSKTEKTACKTACKLWSSELSIIMCIKSNTQRGLKMAKTDLIHIRINPETKLAAEKVFERLGINTSYAVSLFLNQVIMRDGLPFSVEIYRNDEQTEAELFASSIDSTDGKGVISRANQTILHLYANGDIDYETALFALKRNI